MFLAQRLLISGHLFHRTCFKCARCGALLSVANYYETQDGKYCCETCPDEERRAVSPPPPPAFVDGDHRGSLVGNRRALFETLAAADCTDDVKASKKALRPASLKMTEPVVAVAADEKTAVVTTTTSDDNDSGVVVVSDKKECGVKTSGSGGSRETLSEDACVDEPCGGKEDVLDEDVLEEDKTTTAAPSLYPPSPAPAPAPQSAVTATLSDTYRIALTADDNDLGSDKCSPVSSSAAALSSSGGADPKPFDKEDRILFADDEPAAVVEQPPAAITMKDIHHGPLSDDLKQVLEYPSGNDTKDHPVESPEDLEIKTLANKLLKMDYYESSKEVPVPSPRKKIKSPVEIIKYPESLNPFDDEEDDCNGENTHNNSTNPFGSDLEDEEEPPPKANVSLTSSKANVSLNPFSSDEDEDSYQPPLPRPR